VPPCIRNIIRVLKTSGDPDHYQRLALVWYLRWVGYDQEAVVSLFKRFAKDYNEKVTRYQVEYAFRKNYIMFSCSKMKEMGMCLDCGWSQNRRNPVTFTYARADVPEEVKETFFELVKVRLVFDEANQTNRTWQVRLRSSMFDACSAQVSNLRFGLQL
jgi:DNA primase large subunit